MRKSLAVVFVAVVAGFAIQSRAGDLLKHRVNVGAEYDILSDADSAAGGYVSYELDLPDPVSVLVELNYVSGDFDVPAGSGGFSSMGVIGALLVHFPCGRWEPYVGAGGGKHFNDFDTVDYDDKVTMVWIGGTKVAISQRIRGEVSLRYRTLRPDSVDSTIGEINLDGWILRAGLSIEL